MAKVVSFDFDGTLTTIEWNAEAAVWINSKNPNRRMIRLLKRIHDRGYEIHIVTRRSSASEKPGGPSEYEEASVREFMEAHGLTGYVKAVHFCGDSDASGDKAAILKAIGSVRHYDDLRDHVDQAIRAGAKGRKVPRPHESE